LPLAPNARITENAADIKPGEGLFKSGGKTQLLRTLVDTERCGTLTQALMDETADGKTSPIIVAVRLKVSAGKVSEIETIVARSADLLFKPDGLLETRDQDWETLLPAAQRSTREYMNREADKYYEMFADEPKVQAPFATPCHRWENGTHTTPNGDCSPKGIVETHPARRYPVTDVEAGIAAAITTFGGRWPDVHLFKMRNGKIELVQAVVGPVASGTGWPND
jgi:hypothetical protein